MKHNWEYKRLGDVCEIKQNIDKAKKVFRDTEIIKYIDISSIDKNTKSFIPTIYKMGEAPSRAQQCVKYGDVLISLVRPNLKNITFVDNCDKTLVASSGFCILRGLTLISRYIYLLVNSKNFTQKLINKCAGAAYPAVKEEDIKNISIPVPPREVQERIVAELDAINEGIAGLREQVKDFDSLAQSLFYETFGDPLSNPKAWPVKEFKSSVIEMFLGPFGSALKTECYVPEEQSFGMIYEQKHAIKGTINQENHFIDEKKFNSLKRFEVLPNDFIMSCRGTIGKLYQVPENAPRGIIHPSVMKIRLNNSYNSTFFKFLMPIIIDNESTKGNCVQMAITAKELGKKLLILPPLALQQQFAEQIEEIEKMKRELEAQIAEAQTLLDSRMDYWFN